MPELRPYASRRNLGTTPEPAGAERIRPRKGAKPPRFVVQEHHARALHWDFRLEREGVLVSWAVPRGVPVTPLKNHLAVHVEDHPLDYMLFEGTIPAGNYGAGSVSIWDRGTYEEHKWSDREVMVTLHGRRIQGRYVLFQTGGKNWMIHRMDPPQEADWTPLPEALVPMLARPAAALPADGARYGFEFKWDGIRVLMHVEGGRMRLHSRSLEDVTRRYPELRALAEATGGRQMLLDGEIIALDAAGRPSFEVLQGRIGLTADADIRRATAQVPVFYMVFDVVHLDGRDLMPLPYRERRAVLEGLKLAGAHWQTPPGQVGDGADMLAASRDAGLEGVVAKRLDSGYEPGRRTGAWLKVKNHLRQELVIAGWLPGQGRRSGRLGALLTGYHENGVLRYAGKVGTGFSDAWLDRLDALLGPLRREASPFADEGPPAGSIFVEPRLVGEFEFTEWTRSGQMRHPAFKGLRTDRAAAEVVREVPA